MRAIDLSRSIEDYLPASRTAAGGLLKSVLLLLAALSVASLVGTGGYLALRALVPGVVPVWVGVPIGIVALVLELRWISRRFAWMMPWFYLLPAIVFLLAFTFFPVVLTVVLAFTDYAGVRNGQLNVSSETAVVAVDGATLSVEDPRTLDCSDLRRGCNGVRAEVYASATLAVTASAVDGNRVTLSDELPSGREVRSVEMFLPDLGFDFETRVEGVEGRTLVLAKAPPFPPDLEQITLRLDRTALARTIVREQGALLTLDAPLPDGFAATAIARYNQFGWIGARNFAQILGRAPKALLPVFAWNVAFAVLTVLINTAAGVFLAVLLNNPALRLRNLYRTLLIVPWALPNIITIQVWRGFLNENFGAINRLLMLLDITNSPINWLLGDAWAAKAGVLLVNLWLGLPFMMTATLGALSAIPRELYEAARIDGASPWQTFWGVTGPLLRTALVPITLTGFAFNFNNFNVIFLLTDGGPPVAWGTATARGTDILISWAYNEAFRSQGGYAYGLGSAISILVFLITLAVSLVNFRVTGALREEGVGA